MAITFVDAVGQGGDGTSTDIVFNKPAGVALGDFLVTWIASAQGPTLVNPSGFSTLTDQTASTGVQIRVATKIATGSEPSTYTWDTAANTSISCGIMAFRGSGETLRDSAGNGAGNTTSTSSPSLTGVVGTDMVILVGGARPEAAQATNQVSAPTTGGWTRPTGIEVKTAGSGTFPASTSGSYQLGGSTGTFTANFSSGIAIVALAIQEAASAPIGWVFGTVW